MKRLIAAVAMMLTAHGAHALTVDEVTFGGFSSDALNPSVIAAGTTSVTGTGFGNDYDMLRFDGLLPGAQSLTFVFNAPSSGIDNSYSAGGNLLYSTSPFTGPWSGTTLSSFGVSFSEPSDALTLNLDPSFAGTLFVALNFTYGSDLAYNVTLPATVAAVPVPASGGLVLLGLAGLAAMRRRKT